MTSEKSTLHTRNLHRNSYDFADLISCVPDLKHYVFKNAYGNFTINFSIPKAVKLLNKTLLQHFYGIKNWDIPDSNLCPPIPGRADYVHYIADLLKETFNEIPKNIKGLDIGTGASLVYPLLAHQIYGWKMVGSDISKESLENAEAILSQNSGIQSNVELVHQKDSQFILRTLF